MKIPLRLLLMATVLTSCCSTFVEAQTATVIPANLAAGHVGEYATVGEWLQRSSLLKAETRSSILAPLTLIKLLPAGFRRHRRFQNLRCSQASKESGVKITGRIELYKGKPEIRINAAEQLEIE
jgi:hypothetical protein